MPSPFTMRTLPSPSSSLLRLSTRYQPSRHISRPSTTPFSSLIPAPKRYYHPPRTSAPICLHRPTPILSRARAVAFAPARCKSTSQTSTQAPESRLDRDQVPAYELTFTCKVCSTRSSHRLSKQGYHHGTILISCPGCKNKHLIADHLKIFSDKSVTIEDLMREKGNLVKRGSLSAEGDVEFWDDGTTTERSSHFHPNSAPEGTDRLSDAAKSKAEPSTDGTEPKA